MYKVRELVTQLGFTENWNAITDQQPGYLYDFGNFTLEAVQVINMRQAPIFLFSGILKSNGSIALINFQLPLEISSYEQCLAIISYHLGSGFVPRNDCNWLKKGHQLQAHLPWVVEQKAYDERPQCQVERDWFRVASKKLRVLAEESTETDTVLVSFDGEILIFRLSDTLLSMPATGTAWDHQLEIALCTLSFLPKRIMRPLVLLGVWENRLMIGNRSFPVMKNI